MEAGKNNASAARAEGRRRSPEAIVAVNTDPTTTTGTLNHLVMDQVRCHENVADVADTTQIIDPVLQLDCRVLIVGELDI